MAFGHIIETSDNRVFRVRDAGPDYPHAWLGVELKRRSWTLKKGAREILVRRAGSKIIVPYLPEQDA